MIKKNRPVLVRVDPGFRDVLFIESRLQNKKMIQYTKELAIVRKRSILKEYDDSEKRSFQFKI